MSRASPLRFADYELQPETRLLLRDGRPVPLRAKGFDLLLALAGRAGRVVTKDELLRIVWPDVVVEENNIAAQILALRRILGIDVITTVPGRGYRFDAAVNDGQAANGGAPSDPVASTARGQAGVLFGRTRDLERVISALARSRLVTLLGPGGVGKTALARAVLSRSSRPAHWVDLGVLSHESDARAIDATIGRAVDAHASDSAAPADVATRLRDCRLLVLDNAEQVVAAVAARVATLLARLPELRVLVTSQVPLAIHQESIERVDPLAVETAAAGDGDGAVALLVDRIRAANSRYAVPAGSEPLLRRICRRLDGMPLAIEMAAARVPVLGLAEVGRVVDEGFASLRHGRRDIPARQRTLQAALDWSYGLLEVPAQRLFRALGSSAASLSADLAAALVDADHWDAMDSLSSLVDHSLVVASREEPPRLRLLETMRQYALARLREAGEEDAVRARHAAYLLARFQAAHDVDPGPHWLAPREAALADMAQVGDAIAWASRRAPATAVRLSACAMHVAVSTHWWHEAYAWLLGTEPLVDHAEVAPRWRAMWWRQRALHALLSQEADAAELTATAVEVCRRSDEPFYLAHALCCRVRALRPGDPRWRELLAEAEALIAAHPSWSPDIGILLLNARTIAALREGEVDAAIDAGRRALELSRHSRLRLAEAFSAYNLSEALRRGRLHREALTLLAPLREPSEDRIALWSMLAAAQHARLRLDAGEGDAVLRECADVAEAAQRLGLTIPLGVVALGLGRHGYPRASAWLLGLVSSLSGAPFTRSLPYDSAEAANVVAAIEASLGAAAFAAIIEQVRRAPSIDVRRAVLADREPGPITPDVPR